MSTPVAIGRYQVRERLGQGGMGVLYLALDPAIDRLVALKLLRVNQVEIRERFLREARLAARLQHPNIVTVFDVGEHEGQPFIAMEYIPGETMAEIIARRAALPLVRKLGMMVEVCSGLAYAHKHGIVHRDVKPANLMVSRESNLVKILDFGIARGAESTLTQVGMLMGTPNYMSPEQVEGAIVDFRSDIFSVGTVLHELLVYRQAFQADTQTAVLNKILNETPEPVTAINPGLEPALAGMVQRALAKRVEDRYQDLKALAADLTRAIQRIESAQGGQTLHTEPHRPHTPAPGRRMPDASRLAERRAARIASHLEAASARLAAGDLEEALAQTEFAAEVDPEDPAVVGLHERVREAMDAREIARWLTDADAAMRTGALTTAAGLVSRALDLAPTHSRALGLRQAVQQAIEDRERSLERARAVARSLEQAEAHLASGAIDAALRAAGEALGYDPQSAAALALRERVQATASARIDEAIGLARSEAASEQFSVALRRLEQLRPRDGRVDVVESEIRQAAKAAELRRQAEEAAREAERRAREAERRRAQADEQIRQARGRLAAGEFGAALSLVEAVLIADPARADADSLRREIHTAWTESEARRERDEAVRRALSHARSQADQGRHQDALAGLEPFRDVQAVAAFMGSLRAEITAIEDRARVDAERQARNEHDRRVMATIARAHDLLAAQRAEEALAALQSFSPPDDRVTDALAVLRREIESRAQAQLAAEARARDAADRARRDAEAGRMGAAIAQLERFLPRHPETDATLAALHAAHERQAHDVIARAVGLCSSGREGDAFALLEQFDPPHRLVADALIRLKAEAAAREVRRQAEAAAAQRHAEARAQTQALDAWVADQCARAQTALASGRFAEAAHIAENVLARVPDAVQAGRILDDAVGRQAEAEAAAARRSEIARSLASAGDALDAGDPAMARAHVDAAAAVGADAQTLAPLRAEIETLEAELDARRRRDLHDRRAAAAIEAAYASLRAGDGAAAIKRLERFVPPHPDVSAALARVRADVDELDAQRAAALEAERARAAAAAAARAAEAAAADVAESDVSAETLAPIVAPADAHTGAADARTSGGTRTRPANLLVRNWKGLLATAAIALIAISITAVRLLQRETLADAGPSSDDRVRKADIYLPPDPVVVPPKPGDDPPASAPMVALVIDAAPWGRVTRITRAGTQQDLPLEGERHTPYVARLPAGTYEVTVERFGRNLVHSVTIREAADNRVLFEFDGVDVDGYLRRVAS